MSSVTNHYDIELISELMIEGYEYQGKASFTQDGSQLSRYKFELQHNGLWQLGMGLVAAPITLFTGFGFFLKLYDGDIHRLQNLWSRVFTGKDVIILKPGDQLTQERMEKAITSLRLKTNPVKYLREHPGVLIYSKENPEIPFPNTAMSLDFTNYIVGSRQRFLFVKGNVDTLSRSDLDPDNSLMFFCIVDSCSNVFADIKHWVRLSGEGRFFLPGATKNPKATYGSLEDLVEGFINEYGSEYDNLITKRTCDSEDFKLKAPQLKAQLDQKMKSIQIPQNIKDLNFRGGFYSEDDFEKRSLSDLKKNTKYTFYNAFDECFTLAVKPSEIYLTMQKLESPDDLPS